MIFYVKQDQPRCTCKQVGVNSTHTNPKTNYYRSCQVRNISACISPVTLHISTHAPHNVQVYLTWASHNFEPLVKHLDTIVRKLHGKCQEGARKLLSSYLIQTCYKYTSLKRAPFFIHIFFFQTFES